MSDAKKKKSEMTDAEKLAAARAKKQKLEEQKKKAIAEEKKILARMEDKKNRDRTHRQIKTGEVIEKACGVTFDTEESRSELVKTTTIIKQIAAELNITSPAEWEKLLSVLTVERTLRSGQRTTWSELLSNEIH